MPKPQGEFKSDSLSLHPWAAHSPACSSIYHINHINNCTVSSQGCILGLSGCNETIEFNRSVQGKWIYGFGPWTKLSSKTIQVKGHCKKGNGLGKQIWGRGEVGKSWEGWREGKLCLGCIAWEKNLFSIIKKALFMWDFDPMIIQTLTCYFQWDNIWKMRESPGETGSWDMEDTDLLKGLWACWSQVWF